MKIPRPNLEGREKILGIHTRRMFEARRITTPALDLASSGEVVADADAYECLISSLASITEGFTGAELAGLVRAGASYALERAVTALGGSDRDGGVKSADSMTEGKGWGAPECRVGTEDFGRGLADALRSKPPAEWTTSTFGGTSAGDDTPSARGDLAARIRAEASAALGEDIGPPDGRRAPKSVEAPGSRISAPGSQASPAAAVEALRSEMDIGGGLSAKVRVRATVRARVRARHPEMTYQ